MAAILKETVIYCRHSARSPEHVIGSFEAGTDDLFLLAAKVHMINEGRAMGLDVLQFQFREEKKG